MIINTNIQAMSAARNFGINTKNKAKSAEKLSSGYSINRAADDIRKNAGTDKST